VKVGKDDDCRSFDVHESLLCSQSRFFTAALKGEWLESKTRIIELPEQAPEAFELYFGWLYSKTIHSEKTEDLAEIEADYHQLVHAYYLAEMIQDIDFADALIDAIIGFGQQFQSFPAGHTNSAYIRLPKESPLRRLLVEKWVCEGGNEWHGMSKHLTEDALRDIVEEFLKFNESGGCNYPAPYSVGNACAYHQHVKANQPCYLTKST